MELANLYRSCARTFDEFAGVDMRMFTTAHMKNGLSCKR